MQVQVALKLLPSEAADEAILLERLALAARRPVADLTGYRLVKRSIDARKTPVYINLLADIFIGETPPIPIFPPYQFPHPAREAKRIVIIGAGPAGLFAALRLLQMGLKPIILERGKDVRARRRDLAALNKEGKLNPESNYCFGEGGAGTYSDGKLYTRSSKRGDIKRILQLFVQFGAPENILFDAHPHIGTNKLPQIITAMREMIIQSGGEIFFEKKMTGMVINNGLVSAIQTADGDSIPADACILATGHSAHDVYELLHNQGIAIEAKPFALGVRVEHPQALIDRIQYHAASKPPFLPPAAYSLVQQVDDRGVFSFCMCPGGIIAPASTDEGQLVVNGWSPSKRDNPFANSGMVVQIDTPDALPVLQAYQKANGMQLSAADDPLHLLHFQAMVERQAFTAGGGLYKAPAQRMADFTNRQLSSSLPANSYLPGLHAAPLEEVLPPFVHHSLAQAFRAFGKMRKGFFTNEANVVATESRTSSPVRIPRNRETFAHPQISNLYPCAEGAGYAGGIVSAAMDGEAIAVVIAKTFA